MQVDMVLDAAGLGVETIDRHLPVSSLLRRGGSCVSLTSPVLANTDRWVTVTPKLSLTRCPLHQAGLGAGRRDEPGHPPRPQPGPRVRAGQEVGLLQTGPPRPGGARPPGGHGAAEARGLPRLQLRSDTRGLRQKGR